jgi:hypothetical protein
MQAFSSLWTAATASLFRILPHFQKIHQPLKSVSPFLLQQATRNNFFPLPPPIGEPFNNGAKIKMYQ